MYFPKSPPDPATTTPRKELLNGGGDGYKTYQQVAQPILLSILPNWIFTCCSNVF